MPSQRGHMLLRPLALRTAASTSTAGPVAACRTVLRDWGSCQDSLGLTCCSQHGALTIFPCLTTQTSCRSPAALSPSSRPDKSDQQLLKWRTLMAGQNQEALEQFKQFTGADADTASFYLDSSQGDLQTAVAAFFEQGAGAEGPGVPEPAQQPSAVPPAQPATQPQPASGTSQPPALCCSLICSIPTSACMLGLKLAGAPVACSHVP